MERIINNKFLEFIKIIKNDFKNEKCFNAGGYLGSMLYFDFGNQISKKSILQKEKTIILGSKKIGIRDCYWEMIICDFTLINSDDIDVYSFNFSRGCTRLALNSTPLPQDFKLPGWCAEVKSKFAFFQEQRERFAIDSVVFA